MRLCALTASHPCYEQLRGIDKKIAALKAELNYAATGDRQQYISGIICLEEEKSKLASACGALQWPHGGEASDQERKSGSNDEKGDSEDEEDAATPPPSSKFDVVDSDGEDGDVPAMLASHAPASALEASPAGSLVICERELRQHFHLPLHTAAQKFGICTTAFKKLCRRFGIAKWPHRQLRGIDKKIAALEAELNYSTGDREGCTRSLKALREEKLRISGASGTCSAAAGKTEEDCSDDSSASSSPILASAIGAVQRHATSNSAAGHGAVGNDNSWQDKQGMSDDAQRQRLTGPPKGAEELECVAALSMLAQLAGRIERREEHAINDPSAARPPLQQVKSSPAVGSSPAHSNANTVRMREALPVGATSGLGKRSRQPMSSISSVLCAEEAGSSAGAVMCSASPSTAADIDTPPLDPNAPGVVLSPLLCTLDNRACQAHDLARAQSHPLPPIVPSILPSPSMLSH